MVRYWKRNLRRKGRGRRRRGSRGRKARLLITGETRLHAYVFRAVTPTISAACEAREREREREKKKREEKGITRTSRRGWRAVPCDIHVSRLFMTRGTSGRTRTTPLRNATRASNAYIIYRRKEKKRAGVEWKKIETTPWTRDGLSASCALCL